MSDLRERERHAEWLEDHPPILEDEGWLCPDCEKAHRTYDDAWNCCMPDEKDVDCARYHAGRD